MGWPIIGESLNFISKPTAFYNDRRTKYGRVYKTHLLGQPTIRVIGAENVQKILTHEDELVTHRWPSSTRTIMGENGVIHSGGAEHNSRRIAIAKAFQHSALSTYVPEMQETVHNFIRTWCDKGRILGYPECRTLAFSITSKVLLGCDFTQSKDVEEALANFEDNLFSFPVNIPGSGLHKCTGALALPVPARQSQPDRASKHCPRTAFRWPPNYRQRRLLPDDASWQENRSCRQNRRRTLRPSSLPRGQFQYPAESGRHK
ncbi:cytochrome P450 26A1-like [Lingula anatina]|uniref:Cytochrome P450 26A1-like n=1 Tax=Lingula anatina TaxID=7574 RepID=A0A2R2MKC6_LINAN|nr:cytochrome P450 26A1-like [Lingula anatina]|eukprot:XP_023930650.1 cytochrome P450 26A1-like [Lingula anatina]